jgi:uncharacterized membrane protein YphA (DoxX/SURF4 family)
VPYQTAAQKPGGKGNAAAAGLTVIRITAGIYIFFLGVEKVRWMLDSTPLATQLALWSTQATPLSHWYLERITPGAPVFARLIPLGEMIAGLALVAGFWTRLVAGGLFLAMLNFQIAAGAIFSYAYLTHANGIPLLGSLLGLTLGGGRLPLSLRR